MSTPHSGGKTPKEQHPSLVLGQLQIEPRKAFPQLALKALRVIGKLKASHKIISESHQVRLATTPWFEFLLKPQVERKVQINVTEHRRYRATLRRPFLGCNEDPVSQCARL